VKRPLEGGDKLQKFSQELPTFRSLAQLVACSTACAKRGAPIGTPGGGEWANLFDLLCRRKTK